MIGIQASKYTFVLPLLLCNRLKSCLTKSVMRFVSNAISTALGKARDLTTVNCLSNYSKDQKSLTIAALRLCWFIPMFYALQAGQMHQ
jgi:hypothetical protein